MTPINCNIPGKLLLLSSVLSGLVSCSVEQSDLKSAAGGTELNLHVPSPDWREQVIYLAMIDRFDDGDPSNNDQGSGEYDPGKESHFSGGDLQGVINRLDYLQEMGMTSVWITPPVANQWWDPEHSYGGYHGYWARDFGKIDEHFGDLQLYKQLSHELHQRGMYLMQDIVVNHTGNYFSYQGSYDPQKPEQNFEVSAVSSPGFAPQMVPFHLNDVRQKSHKQAGIYHWTPSISDIDSQQQEYNYQLGGLDDINTSNPQVVDALKQVYGYWIKEVGVDAFRIDTVKYVEHEFWRDFLHGQRGVKQQAELTGRKDFLTLGEVKLVSEPLQTKGEEKIARFLGSEQQPELDTVFAFPLQEEINRVFAAGRPTQWLAHRLQAQMQHYRDPYVLGNFVDNHDVPRFIAGGSTQGLKQAMALIFTIPGIPVVYQGNEQGLHDSRQAMFEQGYLGQAGGSFDRQADMYRFIQNLAKLRQQHKALIHGELEMLAADDIGPGVLAFKRSYQGQDYFVLFNSAEHQSLLNNMPTGLKPGQQLQKVFAAEIKGDSWQTNSEGGLTLSLSPRAILVLKATEHPDKQTASNQHSLSIEQDISGTHLSSDVVVSGQVSKPGTVVLLVSDGNLEQATELVADHKGYWQGTLRIRDLGLQQRRLEVYAPELQLTTAAQHYFSHVKRAEIEVKRLDAAGDDQGRLGQLALPSEETFGKQMDLLSATARTAGSVLELTLELNELTDMWIASNGFDHLCLSLFIDVPGKSGVAFMPELQANLPEGQEWDFAHVAYGWGNFIYSTQGATPEHPGQKIAGAPKIDVNQDKKQITFTYSSLPLGIDSWQGVKFYISSWDRSGEGGVRTISTQGGAWEFKGPDPKAALVMDEMNIEIVREK